MIIQHDNFLFEHVYAKSDDKDSKEEEEEEVEDGDDKDSKEEEEEEVEDGDDKDSKEEEEEEVEDGDDKDSKYRSSQSNNSKYDIFGIEKIYPSNKYGEEWFLNMNDVFDDPQFYPYGISDSKFQDSNLQIKKNEDGSWNLKSKNEEAKVRMNVHTSEGYNPKQIETLDHSQLADKGYMQSEKDWKNIEITGYIKLNKNNIPLTEGRFTWYTRGGHHTDNEPCEGVAYKGDIFYSGYTRFAKEQWHVSYFFTDIKKDLKPIKGKWIGYKFVLYNLEDQSNPSDTIVKMESWIDYNNNGKWVKVDEYIDKGDWGNSGKKCDGKKDQIITWGGPIATFRWDKADDVDFKNFSVREIYPFNN